MMLLHRICTICLFILLTTYNADSQLPYKWQTKELEDNTSFPLIYTSLKILVEPLSYNISLNMIPKYDISSNLGMKYNWYTNGTFNYIEAFIIIEYPTMQINLNAHVLSTREEYIHLYRYPYLDSFKITNLFYSHEEGTLILYFKTEIPSGYYIMQIEFDFDLKIFKNEVGLYKTICKNCTEALKWILVTQLKPTAARYVFPCWDDAVFRTRFAITIAHHPNLTILSNILIRDQWNVGDVIFTQFHSTPPIPTYLVAFVLMDSVCSINVQDNFATSVCCTSSIKQEQMKFALKISTDVIAHLQFRLRISPQLLEIIHIGLPDFSYESAGNWGLNIYRENHLIYNETLHPIDRKLNVSMYVSSLVALQWVGNLVSPTSWTHMWFSQTLALFYGVKAFNKIYGDEDITSLFTYRLQSFARENNIVSQVKPLMYPNNNRDENDRLLKSNHFTNCLKEYAIIAMLENAVTESIFLEATITYLEKYQFSTATPNDFWDILQDMIEGKEVLRTHPPIAKEVQSWLKQRSLPVITVTRDRIANYSVIFIRRSHSGTEDDNNTDNLSIPINYITKSSPDVPYFMWLTPKNEWLTSRQISDWECVIVNWQNTGYYRVKYDTVSLQVLAKYLKTVQRTKIHVLNRAHIIEDAYYFWTEEKLHINTFLNLIYSMCYEEQCAPWYAMQNIIKKMWPLFYFDVSKRAKCAIVDVLDRLLQKVGYTEHSNDTECIKFKRLLAMKWACRLLHPPCLKIAQERLIEHLEDPEKRIILPMEEEWTYCNGLALSNRSIWNKVWKEYKKTRNRKILIYLACSQNLTIIHHYLELTIWKSAITYDEVDLSPKDLQIIYRSIIMKHISKNEVLDYVLENIVEIATNDDVENFSYIIKNVYSKAQMKKISLSQIDLQMNPRFLHKLMPKIEDQLSRIIKWERLMGKNKKKDQKK